MIFSLVKKLLMLLTVIFAALAQGWFSTQSSVFLMKPDVCCPAKRQNILEKKTSFHIFTGRTTE